MTVATNRPRVAGEGKRPNPAARPPGRKGSEVISWIQIIEADLVTYERRLREHSHLIYRGIRKSSKVPGGVDKMYAARAMRRDLLKVSAAAGMSANLAHQFRINWYRRLGQPASRAIRNQGFDLEK